MTTFDLIKYQDALSERMLALKSFRHHFAGAGFSRSGYSQSARRRFRLAERDKLIALGYTAASAACVIIDAEDAARLRFNAGG